MERSSKEAPRKELAAVDPDQDLLDQLDRREAGGPYFVMALAGGLSALAGIVTYFTLTLELQAGAEIARASAVLVFIVSAALLAASHYRFR
jgi:hypothetical protein